jgi:hypothetical protein
MIDSDLRGRTLLRYFKATAGEIGAAVSLTVGRPYCAILRPVATRPERINASDVRCLTQWRNRYVNSFLNEFEATVQQTTSWLTNTVGPDDTRILFMVDEPNSRTFAYMGLAYIDWEKSYVEADAIVRGESAQPGTMGKSLQALLCWAHHHLGLEKMHVRVRSDNPAVGFYNKIGFSELKRVPLRKTTNAEKKVTWVEDISVDGSSVQLVYMRMDPRKYDEET